MKIIQIENPRVMIEVRDCGKNSLNIVVAGVNKEDWRVTDASWAFSSQGSILMIRVRKVSSSIEGVVRPTYEWSDEPKYAFVACLMSEYLDFRLMPTLMW